MFLQNINELFQSLRMTEKLTPPFSPLRGEGEKQIASPRYYRGSQ
jgi:hypothetical protein